MKMEVSGHQKIAKTKPMRRNAIQLYMKRHEGERSIDRRSTIPENMENENDVPTSNTERPKTDKNILYVQLLQTLDAYMSRRNASQIIRSLTEKIKQYLIVKILSHRNPIHKFQDCFICIPITNDVNSYEVTDFNKIGRFLDNHLLFFTAILMSYFIKLHY